MDQPRDELRLLFADFINNHQNKNYHSSKITTAVITHPHNLAKEVGNTTFLQSASILVMYCPIRQVLLYVQCIIGLMSVTCV